MSALVLFQISFLELIVLRVLGGIGVRRCLVKGESCIDVIADNSRNGCPASPTIREIVHVRKKVSVEILSLKRGVKEIFYLVLAEEIRDIMLRNASQFRAVYRLVILYSLIEFAGVP